MKHENVDKEELAKFAQVAAHWWDPQGELKTLHHINPIRLDYIASKVNLSGKKVIDIGCGGGLLSEGMAKLGAEVTGLDMNKSLIEVAKLHQYESGTKVEYIQNTAEALAQERKAQYDVVTCLEMLEHVPHPDSIVKACIDLLKPGGHVFFSTLNRHPKAYLFAVLAAEYILNIIPKNTHDYAKFIRPSELTQWTKHAGGQPQELKGLSYNPLTQQSKLSDDIRVNYFLYATKP